MIEELTRYLLKQYFKEHGCRVYLFPDGRSGLLIRKGQFGFDWAISQDDMQNLNARPYLLRYAEEIMVKLNEVIEHASIPEQS